MSNRPPEASRFAKGKSGNPGGRSKAASAMAKKIRAETRDGAELVEFALSVYRDPKAPASDRRWAHEWLADRGYGKALQFVDLSGDEVEADVDMTTLSDTELDEIIAAGEDDALPAAEAAGDHPSEPG